MHKSQAQAAARRKLLAASRLVKPVRARNGRALPPAWFITDPKRTKHPERIAVRLPRGFGVIFRHFGAKDRFDAGLRLAAVCRARGLVLLVSADPELARVIQADGVHWPEASLRGVRGRNGRWIETASAHSPAAIARAAKLGVDAVIVSTVFESGSASAGKPMGALRFRQIARASALPVYALGGITPHNAAHAMMHAAGWAAIDAVVSGWND
ncbi:MAG: thiamine phosphate synthase [Hyphomonadaceae bacterium]|nr:thiamine phosphate synthase [Hyphomonadaceae bacterium]